MPAKQKTLDDLFLHTLKDIYYAEKKILRNLKTMEKAAEPRSCAKPSSRTEKRPRARSSAGAGVRAARQASTRCHLQAINGILEEGESIMEDFGGSEAADAGILAAAQAVEHYEIVRYGTLKSWAQELGHD
jgi:ferritin-like metal-binding protein YciE